MVPGTGPRPQQRRRHGRVTALCLCLAAVVVVVPRGGGRAPLPAPAAWAAPGAAAPGRRSAVAGASLAGLGGLLAGIGGAPEEAFAKGDAKAALWRTDVPRAVEGLEKYQKQWKQIAEYGKYTAGANIVREGLIIKYVDEYTLEIPAGENFGVGIKNANVVSVTKPELGWKEKDNIISINGAKADNNEIQLKGLIKENQAAGKAMTVLVGREGPALLDNLESKVQEAYISLMDDSLPDLEELQVTLGNLKTQAAFAASATSPTDETMQNLRTEIDKVVKQLSPLAKLAKTA